MTTTDTPTINDAAILASYGDVKNAGGLDWVSFVPPTPPSKAPGDTFYVASTGAYGGGGFRVGVLNDDGSINRNLTVDVNAPNRYEVAKVNWGSSGAKAPDVARLFASVLTLASDVADKVNDALKADA